jgi:hypothetical protein
MNGKRSIELFTDNFLDEVKNINKEFIVLKQFWATYKFKQINIDMNLHILPCDRLMNVYYQIKNNMLQNNIEYTESNNFFGIDKELLFEYYVCDQDTFLDNFYYLDKSHITYSINIKAYLLNIDDILIYNLCKHNDKKLKEVFNNYEYNASFFYEENNNHHDYYKY